MNKESQNDNKGKYFGLISALTGAIFPPIGIILSLIGLLRFRRIKKTRIYCIIGLGISIFVALFMAVGYYYVLYVIPSGNNISTYKDRQLINKYCNAYINNDLDEMKECFLPETELNNTLEFAFSFEEKPKIQYIDLENADLDNYQEALKSEKEKFKDKYNKEMQDYREYIVQIPYMYNEDVGFIQATMVVIKCNGKRYLLNEPTFTICQE